MPVEMRAFIEKGDHLLEKYEQGTDTRTQVVRALKVSSASWQPELTNSIRVISSYEPTSNYEIS
jgi:hypothetical protein